MLRDSFVQRIKVDIRVASHVSEFGTLGGILRPFQSAQNGCPQEHAELLTFRDTDISLASAQEAHAFETWIVHFDLMTPADSAL